MKKYKKIFTIPIILILLMANSTRCYGSSVSYEKLDFIGDMWMAETTFMSQWSYISNRSQMSETEVHYESSLEQILNGIRIVRNPSNSYYSDIEYFRIYHNTSSEEEYGEPIKYFSSFIIKYKNINEINFSKEILMTMFYSDLDGANRRVCVYNIKTKINNDKIKPFNQTFLLEFTGSEIFPVEEENEIILDVKNEDNGIINISKIPTNLINNRMFALFSVLYSPKKEDCYLDVAPNFDDPDFPLDIYNTSLFSQDLTIPIEFAYLFILTPSIIISLIIYKRGKNKDKNKKFKSFNQ